MTTPRDIITAVCRAFGVEYHILVNTRHRTERLADARAAAVYLMRTHTHMSYPEIAAVLSTSPRSHSSDHERYARAVLRLGHDEEFARKVRSIDLTSQPYTLPPVMHNADRARFLAGRERIPAEREADDLRGAVAREAVAREAT